MGGWYRRLYLTNMTARSKFSSPLAVLEIKGVLAKVSGELSMRSLTAAIRTHCLNARSAHKDRLLAFFLACESKLTRHSQQDWNRTIEHEIRRVVGLQSLQRFVLRKGFATLVAAVREREREAEGEGEGEGGLLEELEGELGEMEISEEVHLKTKYFCQWLQFLHERREVKRLRNKEVEDLKKSRLFCTYSLKFQTFLHWKQHTRKARADRDRASQIEQAVAKRTASGAFLAFREKIDILAIEGQLAEAVGAKLRQAGVRAVFGRLRSNREKERGREGKIRSGNIWLFRFYRYITHRLTPLQSLSATKNREKLQKNYQRLSLQLCWKGLKAQVQQTHSKMSQIRSICRRKAGGEFTVIQTRKKAMKKGERELMLLRKSVFLRELIENVEAGSQTSLQYSQKIAAVHSLQNRSAAKQFLSVFTQRATVWRQSKTCSAALSEQMVISSKKKAFSYLGSFKAKRGEYSCKQAKAQALIGLKLLQFRFKQFSSHRATAESLHQQLSKHHNGHLLSVVFKSFSLYRAVSLNEYESLSSTFSALRLKRVGEAFRELRSRAELAGRVERLARRSEWVALKVSFVTILNRMLSNKMRIKAFYQQQEGKLKAKLLDLLKRNSEFMQAQRNAVAKVTVEFAKARLVQNLRREVAARRAEQKLEDLRERARKQRFFEVLQEGATQRVQLQAKSEETCLMLAGNRLAEFASCARDFLSYRQTESRLTYKLQKALARGALKTLRRRTAQARQEKEDREELQKELLEKARAIQRGRAGRCLLGLLRSKPSTLLEKQLRVKQDRVRQVLASLGTNQKECILRKELLAAQKGQFIELLRTQWTLAKSTRKFCRKMKRETAKASIGRLRQNITEQVSEREEKTVYLGQWMQESRSSIARHSLLARLSSAAELKENSLILANCVLRNGFQRLLRQHLSRQSGAIKEAVALRLYACNLKGRALRGLRRATDVEVLKENRARTEHQNSKLSVEKSMEHVRRRSKLMETIERYNHSKVSRVVR